MQNLINKHEELYGGKISSQFTSLFRFVKDGKLTEEGAKMFTTRNPATKSAEVDSNQELQGKYDHLDTFLSINFGCPCCKGMWRCY